MKTYRVTWTETYLCARKVEAESEQAAMDIVRNGEYNGTSTPDQKEFGAYEDWASYEVED